MMQTMRSIQTAVKRARARMGDKSIGTRAESGRFQIVRVTYAANGVSAVEPVSDYGTKDETIDRLNSLTR